MLPKRFGCTLSGLASPGGCSGLFLPARGSGGRRSRRLLLLHLPEALLQGLHQIDNRGQFSLGSSPQRFALALGFDQLYEALLVFVFIFLGLERPGEALYQLLGELDFLRTDLDIAEVTVFG